MIDPEDLGTMDIEAAVTAATQADAAIERLRAKARTAMADVSAWCRPNVMAMIEGWADEEHTLESVSDDLSNASAALEREGEGAIEDATCPAAYVEGARLLEAARVLDGLSAEAIREHRREAIRDVERAFRAPASVVMVAQMEAA